MKKPTLLLLHGICNNSGLFAAPKGFGHYLGRYFDIFPFSYPIEAHRSKPWDFDFHLEHDMPAIWKQVCNDAGEKPYVLGYSMGGMLAMAAQATGVIDAPAIITAASPFTFGNIPLYPPLMRTWVKISALTGYRTVPVRLLGRMLCSLLAAVTPARQAFDLNLFRFLLKSACVNVPVETFLQALTWAKTKKFSDRTGMNDYLPKLSAVQNSVCFIYGSKDRIAPEQSVEAGYQMVRSKNKALIGIAEGTHMNMTCGENARKIAEITNAWCNKDEHDFESQLRLNAARFIIA